MTVEQILADLTERIATLKADRADLITKANMEAAAMGGAIQELEAMLAHITPADNLWHAGME